MLKSLVYQKAVLASDMSEGARGSLLRLAVHLSDEDSGILRSYTDETVGDLMARLELSSRQTYYTHIHEWIAGGWLTTVSGACAGRRYLLVLKSPMESRDHAVERAASEHSSKDHGSSWVAKSLARDLETPHPAGVEINALSEQSAHQTAHPPNSSTTEQFDDRTVQPSNSSISSREESPRVRTPEHTHTQARSAGARAPGEFHSPGEVNTLTSINSSSPIAPSSDDGGGGGEEDEKSSSFSNWVEGSLGYSLQTEEGLAKLDEEPDLALWLSGLMVAHGKLPPTNRNAARTCAKKYLGLAGHDEAKLRHNFELILSGSPKGTHLGYYLEIAKREAPGWRSPGEEDIIAKAERKRRERDAARRLRECSISDDLKAKLQSDRAALASNGITYKHQEDNPNPTMMDILDQLDSQSGGGAS